jgi:hypothetical protein
MIKIADSHNWNKKTYNNCISALRRAFAFGYLDYPDQRHPAASLRCARVGKKDRPQPIGAKLKATMMSSGSSPDFGHQSRLRWSSPTTIDRAGC